MALRIMLFLLLCLVSLPSAWDFEEYLHSALPATEQCADDARRLVQTFHLPPKLLSSLQLYVNHQAVLWAMYTGVYTGFGFCGL